jgi:tripartite ATP-independent transporter DctM subunit
MFGLAFLLMVLTGLPVYAVLLASAALFTAIGYGLGVFDLSLFGVLPMRLVGLLEHDLLQALPLFALSGALLNRLPLTRLLHRTGESLFSRFGAQSQTASQLSALSVGALLSPMNGSVGASLHSLARGVAPALTQRGVPNDQAAATICVASTLGVVIPPSLVLLLLGDAMMRAHTEAVNITKAAVRIVNTQDIMRALLIPGLLVLLLALLVTACRGRGQTLQHQAINTPLSKSEIIKSIATASVIVLLLVGVATGLLYAVEAAATGCLLLAIAATVTKQLSWPDWKLVLKDTLSVSGALMALLVGATAFSLVLRAFDTDALIMRQLQPLAAQPALLIALVLGGLLLCSFVLDAFEMIFLVIPLVMPVLLTVVPDAAWMAAITLLVLQLGFLLPPLGYALLVSSSVLPMKVNMPDLVKALWPQLLVQAALIGAVLAYPQITQWTRPVEAVSTPTALIQ